VKVEGSGFEIAADTIIPALGQNVVIDFIEPHLLKAHPESYETQLKDVFIGGDAMRGAASIIKAVGDGRKVASEIFNRSGIGFNFNPEYAERELNYSDYLVRKSKRVKGTEFLETEPTERKNFDLVVSSLTKEQAMIEASRCLLCDEVCSVCVTVCPNRANYTYFIEPKKIGIHKASKAVLTDAYVLEYTGELEVSQKYQIINIGDFCNECGNCTTFCPTNGAPYRDKPKFYLTSKSFKEVENGFMLSKLNDKTVLIHKSLGEVTTLTLKDKQYVYESEKVKGYFGAENFFLTAVEFIDKEIKEFEFSEAAEMRIMFDAAFNLY